MKYTNLGLGSAIRLLRQEHGLSQERLAAEAGYGEGGAVSISRIENGHTHPTPDRLLGIAKALSVTVDAIERSAETETRRIRAEGTSAGKQGVGPARKGEREKAKARAIRLQEMSAERAATVEQLVEEFNGALADADAAFFKPFTALGGRITDAPPPPEEPLDDATGEDRGANEDARQRIEFASSGVLRALGSAAAGTAGGAAIGGVAAWGTFAAVGAFGTASTGAAISGLTGIAAYNATLAAIGGGSLAAGGAGIAGGTLLLTGVVAAPAALLGLGALAWGTIRSRKQEEELHDKLDKVERELDAARPGYDALRSMLPAATALLQHVHTYGGRAVEMWRNEIFPDPPHEPPLEGVGFSTLTAPQKQRYADFIEIAGSVIAISEAPFPALAAEREPAGVREIRTMIGATLSQARKAITSKI